MIEENETKKNKQRRKTKLNLTKYKMPFNVPSISCCIFNMKKQFNINEFRPEH